MDARGRHRQLQGIARFGLGMVATPPTPSQSKPRRRCLRAYAAEGGSGDLKLMLNKEAAGNVTSVQLYNDYSGRAEIGLVGNDDLSLRVSADGSTWHDALIVDKDDGRVRFPAGIVHAASGHRVLGLVPTPGGDGTVSVWRSDTARTDIPRTATISAVAGDTITLTTSDAEKFGRFTGMMANRACASGTRRRARRSRPGWSRCPVPARSRCSTPPRSPAGATARPSGSAIR